MIEKSLQENGYGIIHFKNIAPLLEIQNIITSQFPCVPTDFHQESFDDEKRLLLVKNTRDEITKSNLIKTLLGSNIDEFIKLFGPDIDVQSEAYLRVSRPNFEKDFIDWHRDTFYGNSYWELNFWFPIFPLREGAGLMIIQGSHLEAATNVHSIVDENNFRSKVTKGSLANELGYLYAPKTDDTIEKCDPSRIKMLTPELGQGVLFFTHAAHRAHNSSESTRITMDLRIRNMLSPTNTKEGYFQPLTRGVVASCVEKMIALHA